MLHHARVVSLRKKRRKEKIQGARRKGKKLAPKPTACALHTNIVITQQEALDPRHGLASQLT
jgi:hypothetical protein